MYLAAAEDVSDQVEVEWWKAHAGDLKTGQKPPDFVISVQPLSVTAERIFSILSQSFLQKQISSLEDYNIQLLSVMLQ